MTGPRRDEIIKEREMTRNANRLSYVMTFLALAAFAGGSLSAQRGGRGGGGGGGAQRSASGTHHKGRTQHAGSTNRGGGSTAHATNRTSVNRNTANVNRNVNNVNVNRNVNVNANGHGYGYGYGYGARPVARGVVAGATAAAVIGNHYATLPSGCATVNQGGVVYHHCGSTWYRSDGGQYLVVTAP